VRKRRWRLLDDEERLAGDDCCGWIEIVTNDPTTIGGITIPSTSPVFLSVVGIHVLIALACAVFGLTAMITNKRSINHPKLGSIYFWSLSAVFATATVLTVVRWQENWYLFALGVISFGTAYLGRSAIRGPGRSVRRHLSLMGTSYIVLLTAFYVDNGKNLPLWHNLPGITFWVLPALIGIPLIARTLARHPLARP
jgi:uncharacterized membrane protein